MQSRTLLPCAILLAVAIAGCSSSNPTDPESTNNVASVSAEDFNLGIFGDMAAGKKIEIFALHPLPMGDNAPASEEESFHGYKILGSAEIQPAEFFPLLEIVAQGESENDSMAAACFNPRHGIQVTYEDQSVESLVICFECLQIYQYKGQERTGQHLTSNDHSAAVTTIYQQHGLEIHKGH